MLQQDSPGTALSVRVRYFAGAAAAAGTEQETVELTAPATLADLVTALGDRHGDRLRRVLAACSFLVDEVRAAADRPLAGDAGVDVLPPFAGG